MGKLELRTKLWEREGQRCWYCDRKTKLLCGDTNSLRATNDHLIPRCRGGTNDETNQVSACRRCNELKGALTEAEFRSMSSVDAVKFNDAVIEHGSKLGVIEVALSAGPGYWKPPGPTRVWPFRLDQNHHDQAMGYEQARERNPALEER